MKKKCIQSPIFNLGASVLQQKKSEATAASNSKCLILKKVDTFRDKINVSTFFSKRHLSDFLHAFAGDVTNMLTTDTNLS